jgi:hypothetical protein
VTIEATEQDIRRVFVDQTICCEDRAMRSPHSRTKDEVRVRVDWVNDKSIISSRPGVDICDVDVLPCKQCPPSAGIALAVLRLPIRDSEKVEARQNRSL